MRQLSPYCSHVGLIQPPRGVAIVLTERILERCRIGLQRQGKPRSQPVSGALRKFDPANVRFGSFASDQCARDPRGMSAMPPTASHLLRASETTQGARNRHMRRSKTVILFDYEPSAPLMMMKSLHLGPKLMPRQVMQPQGARVPRQWWMR